MFFEISYLGVFHSHELEIIFKVSILPDNSEEAEDI